MVSSIERFHCIQDSQLGPSGVHYREVPLYIFVHKELYKGSVLIPLPSPWLTQLSATDAHGKVIVGPEPPTASTVTHGTPTTSCDDMCTLRIKSENGDTVHAHTHTHTFCHVAPELSSHCYILPLHTQLLQTYVLKLQSTETIGTLKEQLNKLRLESGESLHPHRLLQMDSS